ncbi:hypothetical protein Ddc_18901 [Ditylenchus destructor]|nr:hypothetical protein Ddc_18901 [Ditylenchus destructor]
MEVVSSSCEVRGGRERRLKLTTGPAYPAPHQNPGRNPFPCPDPNRFLAGTEAAYPAPLVSRLDDLRPASQRNRHPDRPSLSCLPYSYPAPPSFRPTRQPTSDSTKTNQPTLDPIPHTQSTLSPRIDPRIDQPEPNRTVQQAAPMLRPIVPQPPTRRRNHLNPTLHQNQPMSNRQDGYPARNNRHSAQDVPPSPRIARL